RPPSHPLEVSRREQNELHALRKSHATSKTNFTHFESLMPRSKRTSRTSKVSRREQNELHALRYSHASNKTNFTHFESLTPRTKRSSLTVLFSCGEMAVANG